jgi:uncharacterized membrane protein YGL010W
MTWLTLLPTVAITVVLAAQSLIRGLQEQHMLDLRLYRSAHRNTSNRGLHHVLIPLEVMCFYILLQLLVASTKPQYKKIKTADRGRAYLHRTVSLLAAAAAWSTAVTTLLVATVDDFEYQLSASPWPRAILAALVPLITVWCAETAWIPYYGSTPVFCFTICLWIASWSLQIVIGHGYLERNQPNFVQDSVSLLAVLQSILIAWKS